MTTCRRAHRMENLLQESVQIPTSERPCADISPETVRTRQFASSHLPCRLGLDAAAERFEPSVFHGRKDSMGPGDDRGKTALVLAGGGITGFLYEVGVLTALDELAGRALANDFDIYVGTSAGAVLAALLANGAHAAEIFAAMTQNEAGSPFYFESRDILGVGSGGPLRMMGQFV